MGQAGTKKEKRRAESQAPLLQLNQFLPYLTGSPPSRQECRYRHYKTIYPNSPWAISAAAMPKDEIDSANPSPTGRQGTSNLLYSLVYYLGVTSVHLSAFWYFSSIVS